jgi:thiamine-monophosphate kinase
MARPSEDDLIARYFRPLATDPGAFELRDDCATLQTKPGEDLVLKTDSVAEGVHFFKSDSWRHVAQKALRVNLSDLAAKGAEPRGYLLSVALPADWQEAQLAAFSAGLAEDQATFGVSLLGGDTIRSPQGLVITITVIGAVAAGRMARRGGAKPGDRLYVSGTIGDSALGLVLRLNPALAAELQLVETDVAYLLDRYLLPCPRLGLRASVAACARGAMDVSDGLVLDATRMARASGVDIEIQLKAVPLSPSARRLIERAPAYRETAMTGGDDYELLLSVAEADATRFESMAAAAGVAVTEIGAVHLGDGAVRLIDAQGKGIAFEGSGFRHF